MIGFELGCVSAVDSRGRTIFVADAHHDDEKRFVVRADEKLTAFLALASAIRALRRLSVRQFVEPTGPCQAMPYIKIRQRLT
jgi:MoxR-like ATPase